MRLTYSPEGETTQSWPINLGRLRVAECEAIERRTGLAYGTEFKEALLKGATTARRALLWTLLRREHPRTRYEDVDFFDDELVLEFDVAELREMRAGAEAEPGIDEQRRAMALAAIDAEIRTAEQRAADDVDQVDVTTLGEVPGSEFLPGKAPSAS
ncbi:hypothetical protein OOK41_01345 [Micromonospora sp. NBC_01655]|uniref:hypothetical protein n=1 Tax=Micromonospora sp. NBC_01655 TaxID=2975983 RepID=UPI002257D1DF|nr:hypothetical protein [Micromonospora sp. NBC_01655]MCX4468969.1 hypothetical protein [Micromonospora sp. NBC_01655]